MGDAETAYIADLERQLANARAEASDCCDGYEGQIAMLQEALKNTQSEFAEMRKVLNRIARGAELQAHVMRDPLRTGGWNGAEKVADAFDDIAERARTAVQTAPHEQA